MDYEVYTKLFNCTIAPIIDYASGVWGFKPYDGIEKLQNRAIRSYLGVGKFTPIPALNGEMGWIPSSIRNHCQMIRLWCRIVDMDKRRIPYRTFLWDSRLSENYIDTWTNNVKSIMDECGLMNLFSNKTTDGLSGKFISAIVKDKLMQKYSSKWFENIETLPKLRTYKHLITNFSVKSYVQSSITRQERSVLARLRCGVFPLEIETGRYRGTPVERRFCKICRSGMVEDEEHFILKCQAYSVKRDEMLNNFQNRNNCDLTNFDDKEKLKILLNCDAKTIGKFIIDIFNSLLDRLSRRN